MAGRPQTVRLAPDNTTVLDQLGLLAGLAGSWKGNGFNLIARPDYQGNSNLYLQLNQTVETLEFTPVGSAIPNRGFGQDDIELFGLTYLERISDIFTEGALHIEPGVWVTQPSTNYPPEAVPVPQQIVFRLATIPHGTALVAQGSAATFAGPPTLKTPTAQYAFSAFPSFNSTPFGAGGAINAAGSSEKASAAEAGLPPFTQYDLTVPESAANPRTPFDTNPQDPALPAQIDGVAMQDVINDPITLLQAVINKQVHQGFQFAGTALNIATQPQITFLNNPNNPRGPSTPVPVTDGAGALGNILFLNGEQVDGKDAPNAQTALVYATFWVEKVTHPQRQPFMQLQYAQMTILNFPILAPFQAGTVINLSWPHISVATLRKSFN